KAASPLAAPGANVSPASARSRVDRVSTPAIAALALLIVAAGVLRAVFSVPPSAETARVAQEATEPSPARATLTVAKSPRKPAPQTEPPASRAGFAVLEAAPSPAEAPRARPQTIAEMMTLAEPLASSSDAAGAAPPSLADEPVAPKRAPKVKPRRKVAAREEPIPWWQQWSWIRVP
ncbi:MAG: hypothetical protein AB7G54_07575, partial [Methyloceanibacter sp.]